MLLTQDYVENLRQQIITDRIKGLLRNPQSMAQLQAAPMANANPGHGYWEADEQWVEFQKFGEPLGGKPLKFR